MTFARFIFVQIACTALDLLVTWLLVSPAGAAVFVSRTIGAVSAAAFAIVYLRQVSIAAGKSGFVATSITLISLLVSYGVFTLLLQRNPILQWPLAFAAATLAAFFLSLIGYWRTRCIVP